jgi:hypothetical protein
LNKMLKLWIKRTKTREAKVSTLGGTVAVDVYAEPDADLYRCENSKVEPRR